MEVVAADFLPWDKQLFMLVADTDCTLHVLEFNPESKSTGVATILRNADRLL